MINLDLAFVLQFINFGLLVLILNAFLYKPIRAMLAQRRQEIQAAREKAVAVDEQVQSKVSQYEARLQDARAEAGAKRAELVKAAQEEEARLMEKARQDASGSLAAIRERIATESASAKSMLKEQAEGLSNEICEKILGRSL